MRRGEREIKREYLSAVIEGCDCMRIGLNEEGGAYIVPVNFAYEMTEKELLFYFHGAKEGKKAEMLRQTSNVGFEMDCRHSFTEGKTVCRSTFGYRSVIGKGRAELLEGEEARRALCLLIKRYTGSIKEIEERTLAATAVYRLVATEYCGKQNGKF